MIVNDNLNSSLSYRTSTKQIDYGNEKEVFILFIRNCTFYRKGNHLNICYSMYLTKIYF